MKFLANVQSALQGRVSASGRVAGAASYLCLGTRSRRAARAGGNAYLFKLVSKLLLLLVKPLLLCLRLVLLAQGLFATRISTYLSLCGRGDGSSNVKIRGAAGDTHDRSTIALTANGPHEPARASGMTRCRNHSAKARNTQIGQWRRRHHWARPHAMCRCARWSPMTSTSAQSQAENKRVEK